MFSSTQYPCILLALVWLGVGDVLAATLHACQNYLVPNGTEYKLAFAQDIGPWMKCVYYHDNHNGTGSGTYCFYKAPSYDLVYYPNIPVPAPYDSNPVCPTSAPRPSVYRIRSFMDVTKCITAAGEYDGAPVELQTCRTDIWTPEQVFHFGGDLGNLIRPISGNKCLDVKDGDTNNATQLQVWTCSSSNPNQLFEHWKKEMLVIPTDYINWATQPSQCFDLGDGNTADGTPIQIGGCDRSNGNQVRGTLETLSLI
ncbi:ricin B lectin domain-containing protein [Coprinopsis sp. MPI-PUGE-AT-0042]|nr:ricin B lectin domain-containing protein [Coprinopsis sp. MPI-PUGE-AT-0042]